MELEQSGVLNDIQFGEIIEHLHNKFRSHGYIVKQGFDFHSYKEICKKRKGRLYSYHFDEDKLDLYDGNSFYLVVMDQKQKLIGTVASFKDCMNTTTIAQLFDKRYTRLYGGATGKRHAPSAHRISGNVAYMGDLWIRPKVQSAGLGIALSSMATIIALRKFQPDYIYGLVKPALMDKGGVHNAGYNHLEMQSIDWVEDPIDFDNDFWLVSSDFAYLNYYAGRLLDQIPRNGSW